VIRDIGAVIGDMGLCRLTASPRARPPVGARAFASGGGIFSKKKGHDLLLALEQIQSN